MNPQRRSGSRRQTCGSSNLRGPGGSPPWQEDSDLVEEQGELDPAALLPNPISGLREDEPEK